MAEDRMEGTYEAEQIQVLEGLDPVRRRPGMYIGSTDERGLHHLIYEVVDNSIDELQNGYGDTITVTILARWLRSCGRQRPRHPGQRSPQDRTPGG